MNKIKFHLKKKKKKLNKNILIIYFQLIILQINKDKNMLVLI